MSLLAGFKYNIVHDYDTGKSICTKLCSVTQENFEVSVNTADYEEWKSGAYIQDVFPEMSREEREFLISGTTPKEWDDMFSEEE